MKYVRSEIRERPSADPTKTNGDRQPAERSLNRRSFLHRGIAAGAGAITVGLLPHNAEASGGLTPGDAAILRFLAAAEILETDAWQQYNELCSNQDNEVPGGNGNGAFTETPA